jgi:high affinity Mn2+ porin
MNVVRLRLSAIRARWAILILLAVGSFGCQSFQLSAPETPDASPLAETTAAATDSKPPPPRNLPEAICAYLRCVQSCPCERTAAKIDKEAQTKSPNASDQNGKEDEKGKKGNEKKDTKEDAAKDDPKKDEAKKDDAAKEDAKKDEAKKDDSKSEDAAKDNGKEKDDKKDDDEKKDDPVWFSGHAQATMVTQAHNIFPSPYVGANSLLPNEHSATSETSTLFLAARLWDQGILVFNPEIAGGTGFSSTMGVAGFPNGEITRVGVATPTPYIARLYYQQTIGFGGEQEKVEDGPNLIAGKRDVDRLTITIGKLSATDIVDDNRYSHDPRSQFLNWSLMFNGAWDYPANVRGYTFGVAIDRNIQDWAFRYGVFAEPAIANGAPLDPNFLQANGNVAEIERRFQINDHPGKLRFLAYLNNAHMGDYEEALALMPVNPVVADTRAYRIKYGLGLNFEQEITENLGMFSRIGWNDGHTETWAFTEIDRTASLGFVMDGACWCRPYDRVGLAGVVNGLSQEHRDYLAAGGLGFIIGDGKLNYGYEQIVETYYSFAFTKNIFTTADFQEIVNPAYNRDRGPVAVGSVRVHIEF